MTVGSLFDEKLKKAKREEENEDPIWLAPSTWESMFSSQNARPHSPPRNSLSSCSSLSEASLVRLALNALQGVRSALCSIEKLYAAFSSDPADRSYHRIPSLWNHALSTSALAKILVSIGRSGTLVLLLRDLVDYFTNVNLDVMKQTRSDKEEEHVSYSLVNQAFAVAVGKVLDGYVSALDKLYASVGLRRSAGSGGKVVGASCLNSVVHFEVTLLEVHLHHKELMIQIEALGNICSVYDIALCFSVSSLEMLIEKGTSSFSKFYRGGDLLTYLYTQLQVADPAHRSLLKFLFLRAFDPFCGFIRSWIYEAEISDPYKEFIIEYVDSKGSPLNLETNASTEFPLAQSREGVAVPCFLKDYFLPTIRAGQQLQVVKKLLELCHYVGPIGYTTEDFLPRWSAYFSKNLFQAATLTFDKGSLEAIVLERNNYYKIFLEKFEDLLSMSEFSSEQAVFVGGVPSFPDVSRGTLCTAPFFQSDDRAVSDCSSMKDELDAWDAFESSECSSLSGSEGQTEPEQLIEHAALIKDEERYLSSLKFFRKKCTYNILLEAKQSKKSHEIVCDSQKSYEKTDTANSYFSSYPDQKTLSWMCMPLRFEEPKWSGVSDGQYLEGRSTVYDNLAEFSKLDTGCLPELRQLLGQTASIEDVTVEKLNGKDPPESGTHASDLPYPWKIDHLSKFLSTNPNLTKNASLRLLSEPEGKHILGSGKLLHCFDFSVIEDPCKRTAARLVGCSRNDFGSASTTTGSGTTSTYPEDRDLRDKYTHPINNAKSSSISSPLTVEKSSDLRPIVQKDVSGGSGWETLLGHTSYSENEEIGDHHESLPAIFDIPLDFVIDKCLLQEISLQYKYVSKVAIKLLQKGFDLHGHLLALRRYFFMESADWADLFITTLWHHKWSVKEADQRVSEIQGILELSMQKSSCEQDPYKDRLFVYTRETRIMPPSTSVMGVRSFNFMGLGYQVDWPVNIVLNPSALEVYAKIFSFLIQVKLAVFSLTNVWRSLKELMPLRSWKRDSIVHEQDMSHFNILIKTRQQLNHFVCSLQLYVQSQLSHISWFRFLGSLKHKVKDMMDLESVHLAYLTDSVEICFLSDETRSVASIIESILQCALDFSSCLTSSLSNVGPEQGEVPDRRLIINIPVVLTIKKKFEQSLEELRKCYNKSPKHGEFGLSHFWGCLNYNEYYSGTGNEMYFYA